MEGSYHRRELKAPSIAFSSVKGRKLFDDALHAGTMESYFPLAEHFVTQGHPSFCGIGSLTMSLNSLLVDPKRVWQGVWRWFDESMLDCCGPLDTVKVKGITMSKLACLGRCNGATVVQVLGSSVTLEQFREDIKRVCSVQDEASRVVMIASYHRPKLNQTGSGHFSPIGGYNEAEDMVLIMDVARFKYPPHWAPVAALYEALQPIDPDSGTSRGYLLVSGGSELFHNCNCSIVENDVESNLQSTDSSPYSPTPLDSNINLPPLMPGTNDAVLIADAQQTPKSPLERLCCLMQHNCSACNNSENASNGCSAASCSTTSKI